MSTHNKTVLIIGSGIAGSSLAYQLAKRNYQVTLLDENNQDEIEIFKNKAAIISPHFMLNNPKYNSLMNMASKYAYDLTREFNYSKKDAVMEGVIKLYDNDVADRLIKNILSITLEKTDFKYLSKDLIKKKYDIDNKIGIYFKNGGWVSPHKICSRLIKHKNIKFFPKRKVKEIAYGKKLWLVYCQDSNEFTASNLVFCNSFALSKTKLFNDVDLKKIEVKLTGFPVKKSLHIKKLFRIVAT